MDRPSRGNSTGAGSWGGNQEEEHTWAKSQGPLSSWEGGSSAPPPATVPPPQSRPGGESLAHPPHPPWFTRKAGEGKAVRTHRSSSGRRGEAGSVRQGLPRKAGTRGGAPNAEGPFPPPLTSRSRPTPREGSRGQWSPPMSPATATTFTGLTSRKGAPASDQQRREAPDDSGALRFPRTGCSSASQ